MTEEYLGIIAADKRIKELEAQLAEAQRACIDIYNDYDANEVANYCSKSVGRAWEIGGELLTRHLIINQKILEEL